MGHNGHGINLYGVSMTLMGNKHAGGQSSLTSEPSTPVGEVRHDIKYLMMLKINHDVKIYIMLSKRTSKSHNVK